MKTPVFNRTVVPVLLLMLCVFKMSYAIHFVNDTVTVGHKK